MPAYLEGEPGVVKEAKGQSNLPLRTADNRQVLRGGPDRGDGEKRLKATSSLRVLCPSPGKGLPQKADRFK